MSAAAAFDLHTLHPAYSVHRVFAELLGDLYRYTRGLAVRMARGDVDLADDYTQIAAIELWKLRAAGVCGTDEHLRSLIRLRLRLARRTERRQGLKNPWRPKKTVRKGAAGPPPLAIEDL